jgi:hypothetical protein
MAQELGLEWLRSLEKRGCAAARFDLVIVARVLRMTRR